jgi:hypothetical protein
MSRLENLFLGKSHIESIEPLLGLTSLKRLNVGDGVLTEDMRRELTARLPKCSVD